MTQQAWYYTLEGLGTPPAKYTREDQLYVWHVGKLVSKLNAWCRKLYLRRQREYPLRENISPEDYHDTRSNGPDLVDVLDLIDTTLTDDEAACVFFRAAGYPDDRTQEILGMSPSAYRVRLHRLRSRMKTHASSR